MVEAAVIGLPDPKLGEVPVAAVRLRPDATVDRRRAGRRGRRSAWPTTRRRAGSWSSTSCRAPAPRRCRRTVSPGCSPDVRWRRSSRWSCPRTTRPRRSAPRLASILDQTHDALEVLVVDDGSTDVTPSIIERAAAATRGWCRSRTAGTGVGPSPATRGCDGRRASGWRWSTPTTCSPATGSSGSSPRCATFPDTRLLTDDRLGWRLDAAGQVVVEHRFPGRHTWRVGAPRRLDAVRHFTDRFGHLDLVVRRDFLEATGATYPEDMSTAEDLTFYNTLLFWPDDPRPVRVARGSYYYRLAPTSRTAGGREARVLMGRRGPRGDRQSALRRRRAAVGADPRVPLGSGRTTARGRGAAQGPPGGARRHRTAGGERADGCRGPRRDQGPPVAGARGRPS